jgi:hypothetical protein
MMKDFIRRHQLGFMFWTIIGLIVFLYLVIVAPKATPNSSALDNKLLEAKLFNEEVAKNTIEIQRSVNLYNAVQDSVIIRQDSQLIDNETKINDLMQVISKQKKHHDQMLASNAKREKIQSRYDSLMIVNTKLAIDYQRAIEQLNNDVKSKRKGRRANISPDSDDGSKGSYVYTEKKMMVDSYTPLIIERTFLNSGKRAGIKNFSKSNLASGALNDKKSILSIYDEVIREESMKLANMKKAYSIIKDSQN